MRDLFRPATVRSGCVYALVVTALVTPQIVAYGELSSAASFTPMVLAALLCHFLAGLVLFGWGSRAPMPGLFRDRVTTQRGIGVSVGAACIVGGVMMLLDPILKQAVIDGQFGYTVGIKYPETVWGCATLMFWQVGFSSLLFTASALVYLVRLTGRLGFSMALVVLVQGGMSAYQLEGFEVSSTFWGLLLIGMISRLVSCMLFLRYGLIGPVVFGAIVAFRVVFSI